MVRFCALHPNSSDQFNWEADGYTRAFCPAPGRCNESIAEGVFLRHIGCPAQNPFWNQQKGKVEISGHARSNTIEYNLKTSPGSRNVKVLHWEIGLLKRLPSDVPEMWFPLMLLRATAETNQERRVGALVELAGAIQAGKSILTLQAMDQQGYVPDGVNDRNVQLDDFIFSRRPPSVADNPMLEILYLRGVMKRNRPDLFLPQGTKREPGDLKVAFLKPAPPKEVHTEEQRRPEFFRKVTGELKGITNELLFPVSGRPFWYTVAFYDTAGEAWVEEDWMPDLKALDKVAVVLDGTDLFGPTKDSIKIANSRIANIENKDSSCVVITKLDLAMASWTQAEKDKVHRIAEDLNNDTDPQARNLLLRWLCATNDPDHRELQWNLGRVGKVFFVWTVDLPQTSSGLTSPPTGRQPTSYGLAKFICWCLDVDWKDINHG